MNLIKLFQGQNVHWKYKRRHIPDGEKCKWQPIYVLMKVQIYLLTESLGVSTACKSSSTKTLQKDETMKMACQKASIKCKAMNTI